MKFGIRTGAFALALALVACGGEDSAAPPPPTGGGSGGGGGGGGGGTPTPSPAPAVTYTRFNDLTGDRSFNTSCAILRNGLGGAGPFDTGFTFNFLEAPETYTISVDGRPDLDVTFGPSDLLNLNSNGFRYRKPNGVLTNAPEDFFQVFNPGVDVVPTDYARFARFTTIRGDGTDEDYRCVFGVPTELDDDLPSGVVTYSQLFSTGIAFEDNAIIYDLAPSSVEFSADPATGAIEFTVTITGQPSGGGSPIVFGQVSGTTSIDGTVQSLDGQLVDQGNTVAGSFGGWFFGPQGTEMGLSWGGTLFLNGGNRLRFVGNTIGSNP